MWQDNSAFVRCSARGAAKTEPRLLIQPGFTPSAPILTIFSSHIPAPSAMMLLPAKCSIFYGFE
jgi:hypothetical protein